MTEETPGPGHNSGVAGDLLRRFVERVERVEEQKRELAEDQKQIMAEVKAAGLDAKTVRRVVKERKKDRAARAEEESLFDLYWHALGMAALED